MTVTPQCVAVSLADLLAYRLANAPSEAADVDHTADAWLRIFAPLTDQILTAALSAHAQTSRWWPTPADVFGFVDAAALREIHRRIVDQGDHKLDGLSPRHRGAFLSIGGFVWDYANGNAFDRERLRVAFLAACAAQGDLSAAVPMPSASRRIGTNTEAPEFVSTKATERERAH